MKKRKFSKRDFKVLIKKHGEWLESGGKHGRQADLSEVYLRGSDINGVNLDGAILRGADLSGAILRNVSFTGASFLSANLQRADLSNANLIGANLMGADLRRTILTEADLWGATLRGANLTGARLLGAQINEAKLERANLSYASLRRAKMNDTDFTQSLLVQTDLSNCDLSGALLNEADITRWVIKDVKCSHIFINGKKMEFGKGDFEKAFTYTAHNKEMVLPLPFSDFTQYIGLIIQKILNREKNRAEVLFQSQEALSFDTSKLTFVIYTREDFTDYSEKFSMIQRRIDLLVEKEVQGSGSEMIFNMGDEGDFNWVLSLDSKKDEFISGTLERFDTLAPLLRKIIREVRLCAR